METLKFIWHDPVSLSDELARPISRVSAEIADHGRLIKLTLWHADGGGIRIQSEMFDVAPRVEVGVLEFTRSDSVIESEHLFGPAPAFKGSIKPIKLTIVEGGTAVESGIVLEAGDGKQIAVTAGVAPYTLAVKGIGLESELFKPEYPLSRYIQSPFP